MKDSSRFGGLLFSETNISQPVALEANFDGFPYFLSDSGHPGPPAVHRRMSPRQYQCAQALFREAQRRPAILGAIYIQFTVLTGWVRGVDIKGAR